MLRLVVDNYEEENEMDVETGTCDFCISQTNIYSASWTFRDVETNETVTFSAQEWSWGDVYTMPQCSNIPAFSQWLSTSSKAQEVLDEYEVLEVADLNRFTIRELLNVSGYTQKSSRAQSGTENQ